MHALDIDLGWAIDSSRGWLVQSLRLLQANGKTKRLCSFRKGVDDVMQCLLGVGEECTVICEQQLYDQYLNGLGVCKETA